jgi:hypothetical protein
LLLLLLLLLLFLVALGVVVNTGITSSSSSSDRTSISSACCSSTSSNSVVVVVFVRHAQYQRCCIKLLSCKDCSVKIIAEHAHNIVHVSICVRVVRPRAHDQPTAASVRAGWNQFCLTAAKLI